MNREHCSSVPQNTITRIIIIIIMNNNKITVRIVSGSQIPNLDTQNTVHRISLSQNTHTRTHSSSSFMKNMIFKTITAISTVMTGESPWWMGAPTKLLKKTTLVQGTADVAALQPNTTANLPVYTLTFEIPKNVSFSGKARPHSTVRMDLGDVVKMVIPGYKPKSYSVSALGDNEFDITFKVYPNGRASGFLDRLQEGDSINSFGIHCGKTRRSGSFVGLIAYGVGITEAWPIARAELEKGDAQKVVLLWTSRT
jgi:hypothetical protein